MTKIIDLKVQKKVYVNKKERTMRTVLTGFELEVSSGEKIAIVGESGVGKSSLLNILGLIDKEFVGEYSLFGLKTNELSKNRIAEWRNQKIGFVLQESALIDSLNIEDNIKLPLLYADSKKKLEQMEFEHIVKEIGIESILKKKPFECSGGEKARAVFARGILMKPQIILADEPTAALDVENRERIINLLFKMNQEYNTTIITVTHDLEVANRYDRVIRLERSK